MQASSHFEIYLTYLDFEASGLKFTGLFDLHFHQIGCSSVFINPSTWALVIHKQSQPVTHDL